MLSFLFYITRIARLFIKDTLQGFPLFPHSPSFAGLLVSRKKMQQLIKTESTQILRSATLQRCCHELSLGAKT